MEYENIIINSDCLELLHCVASDSADIIIADPPYNIGKDFGNNHDKLPLSDYLLWSQQYISECLRILKPSGTFFIYGFPEILAHISVTLPINKHKWLQWHYTNKNVANLNFWQRSHESILCIWKEKPIFNRDEIREPYTGAFAKMKGKVRPSTKGRFGGKESIFNPNEKGALPRDVIKIPALAGGSSMVERIIFCKNCDILVNPEERGIHQEHELLIHPTQKPFSLTERLILSCKPYDNYTALIPFCGSGSECKCVLQTKGHFLSFEINPDYVFLANKVITTI